MSVTERMHALGGHAKSSRQPPLKERKSAKADESAAKQDAIDESILENGATRDSAGAVIIDDVTPKTVVHESGNGGAVAEIARDEHPVEVATAAPIAAEAEPQPVAADDRAMQARSVQEDDATGAAKRAIIHEWENWSALHSDELDDPNVAEYFFRHLETKKARLLDFISDNKQKTVFGLLLRNA